MSKQKIVYYSDCPFFAGCENMLGNFLDSKELNDKFETFLIYRYTQAYSEGLKARIENINRSKGLVFLNFEDLYKKTDIIKVKFFRKVTRLFIVSLLKYLLVMRNSLILYKEFKKIKPDILHINNGGYPGASSCISAVIAAKLCKINKIVYVVNNIALPYVNVWRKLDKVYDGYVKRNVSYFVTGSKFASQKLVEALNLKNEKTLSIPNGIKNREISENPQDVLSRLNIDKRDRIVIGIVALLEKRKGHIYFLEAFKELREILEEDKLPLVLIEGDGEEKERLLRFITENKLGDNIKLIGNEQKIFNLLNAIDIFVLPSIANEDFPNVILEAMSLGKPIISTFLAGIPEQIENNKNGFIVQPKNVAELKEVLAQVIKNKDLIEKYGNYSKELFYRKYTVDISVNKYIDIYTELLK